MNTKFLHHSPCENCGSRDNLGVWEDHTYCFGCRQYNTLNGELPKIKERTEFKDMIDGKVLISSSNEVNNTQPTRVLVETTSIASLTTGGLGKYYIIGQKNKPLGIYNPTVTAFVNQTPEKN